MQPRFSSSIRFRDSVSTAWLKEAFIVCLTMLLVNACVAGAEPWATGTEFDAGAERWIALSLVDDANEIRKICQDLAATQQLALVIDRRCDPNRPVDLELPVTGSCRAVLEKIAASHDAQLRTFGDCLFVLPTEFAVDFKTVLALRVDELQSASGTQTPAARTNRQAVSPRLTAKLVRRQAFVWEDFTRPRELVIETAERAGVTIKNPQMIPHDLWAGGAIPHGHTVELLSFVLFQYGLTYRWVDPQTIEVVAMPAELDITRSHRLTATQLEAAKSALREQYPKARWERADGSRSTRSWNVTGPADLHEAIASLTDPAKTAASAPRVGWKDRTFTMQVKGKSLVAVLSYLQQAGLPVRFDAKQLEQAGFDPTQLIEFEVTEATAEQLFSAICNPLRIPFQVGETEIQIGGTR